MMIEIPQESDSKYSKPPRPSSLKPLSLNVVVILCLFVTLLICALSTFLLNQRLQQQSASIQSLKSEVDLSKQTIELLQEMQTTLSEKTDTSVKQQKLLADSFDGKLAAIRSQLSTLQQTVQSNNQTSSDVLESLHSTIAGLSSTIETFKKMFGMAPSENNPQSPPERFPADPSVGHVQYGPGGVPSYDPSFQEKQPSGAVPYRPPAGQAEEIPDTTKDLPETQRAAARADSVKSELLSCWNAYKKYAWGHDELCPNSMRHKDWGGKGIGLTASDALSTLYLMGLHDEFNEALKLVTEYIDYDQDIRVSAFETTIRVVGGLLSAFELSGESNAALLDTAVYVMNKLLVAYNTSSGIPHQTVNLKTHEHWNPDWSSGASILSEFGSVQLELRTLSYHTKDPIYDMKGAHLTKILEAKCGPDMMCPTMFDVANGEPRSDHITLGALGDSYFEYLLKQYLLTDKSETRYRTSAAKVLDSIRVRLFRHSTPSRQGFIGEYLDGAFDYKMDHLACFAGGMYALAAMHLGDDDDAGKVQSFRVVAEEITETCYQMYDQQVTGLGPEIVDFPNGQDFRTGEAYYLLRPETVESIFYMWRLTKNQKYRNYQWKIFQHIKKHCKSAETGGYSGISMVNIVPAEQDDLMQSFFLAETLKYIYLTFVDDSVLDLHEWVLNTEAHPLKIRKRDPLDVWRDWEQSSGSVRWRPPTLDGVGLVETERMMQERLASGDARVVADVDPLGSDMKSQGDEYQEQEDNRAQFDPNENVYSKKAVRHDSVRKVKQKIRDKVSAIMISHRLAANNADSVGNEGPGSAAAG